MPASMRAMIARFLDGDSFAVAGASANRAKFGNKVLRCYQQHGLSVYGVNPHEDQVEGARCYPDLGSLPEVVDGLSIVTRPEVTERIVADAIEVGIKHLWMQPGAESAKAIRAAREKGIEVIEGGPCLLVELGFEDK